MKTILLFLSLIFSIQAYANLPPRLSPKEIKQVEDTIRIYEMCLGTIKGFDYALYLTSGKSLRNSPKYKEWKKKNDKKRQVVWSLKNKMYEDAERRSLSSLANATNALKKAKKLKKITCNYKNQLNRQVLSEFPDLIMERPSYYDYDDHTDDYDDHTDDQDTLNGEKEGMQRMYRRMHRIETEKMERMERKKRGRSRRGAGSK